jgi:outer membrane protein assembly factor BamB
MTRWLLPACLASALFAGCGDDDSPPDPGADAGSTLDAGPDAERVQGVPCAIDQPFPYPDGNPYATNHVDPANSNFVPCEGPTSFALDYRVLEGYGIIQPNTYSPDGATTYVTTLPDDEGCNLFAIDVATGATAWRRCDLGTQLVAGSVEVDEDGTLYCTSGEAVTALDPGDGATVWRTDIADRSEVPRAFGLKMTPDGWLVTQYSDGVVYLLDRADGTIVASLDVATELGFVAPEKTSVPAALLPDYVQERMMRFYRFDSLEQMSDGMGAVVGSSGAFVDNTVAVSPAGQIFTVGGGPDPETGAQIALDVRPGPTLAVAWTSLLPSGTGSSSALSKDGRLLAVGDGDSNVRLFHVDECNANTDGDTDPATCAPAWTYPFAGGPLRGAVTIDDRGRLYFWAMAPDRVEEAFCLEDAGDHAEVVWARDYGEDWMITSILTLANNAIYVDMGEVIPEIEVGQFTLPASQQHFAAALDPETGDVLHQVEVPDDSMAELQIAPDGSLFLTCLPILTALTVDPEAPDPIGGLQRFVPTR